MGALVAARQPRNPIGWIFSAEGVLAGLTIFSSYYHMRGLWRIGPLYGIDIARWLAI